MRTQAVDAGRRRLRELTAWVAQPEFGLSHSWRADDLLVYDNRCVLHRGRPWAAGQRRWVTRTTATTALTAATDGWSSGYYGGPVPPPPLPAERAVLLEVLTGGGGGGGGGGAGDGDGSGGDRRASEELVYFGKVAEATAASE